MISRKTKKALKKYWYTQGELFKESEDYLLSILPNCKWCNGGGVERAGIWDTGYDCPDCRGTGKYGWQYDQNNKMIMMKEFTETSNNANRLKRKGMLKRKQVERCYVCQKKNVYGYKPEYCCMGNYYGIEYPCGCMGLPLEPPLCSVKCAEKVFGKIHKRRKI